MMKERRDWVQDYKALHGNKIPDDLTGFYDRFNVEAPLTLEEQEIKRLEEEEAAKNKKKKGEKKKEAKKGKGKGKKGDGEEKKQVVTFGPSEIVQKFD